MRLSVLSCSDLPSVKFRGISLGCGNLRYAASDNQEMVCLQLKKFYTAKALAPDVFAQASFNKV